jgi:hypothetical protein
MGYCIDMSYVLMPALVSPPVAEIYKKFQSPAAPATVSDVLGKAESIKRNPTAASPAPLPPASATWGRTSFTA